jgi:hypothetical protein
MRSNLMFRFYNLVTVVPGANDHTLS